MTILDAIKQATSDRQIRQLLNLGNSKGPSGSARRGWLRAARERRLELNIVELKPNVIKIIARKREQRRKHLKLWLRSLVPAQSEPKLETGN